MLFLTSLENDLCTESHSAIQDEKNNHFLNRLIASLKLLDTKNALNLQGNTLPYFTDGLAIPNVELMQYFLIKS